MIIWELVFFLFFGILLGSFGIIAPLIVLRTAIPITRYLGMRGLIDIKRANLQSKWSVLLWLLVDIATIVLLGLYGTPYMQSGAAIGVCVAVFVGVGRTGPTVKANVKDFIKRYHRYMDVLRFNEALEAVEEYAFNRVCGIR